MTSSSAQKKATLPIMEKVYGITLEDIKNLVTTTEEAVAFILYHEESHKLNDDIRNPARRKIVGQFKDKLLTRVQFDLHPINVNIEARANADAFKKLTRIKIEYNQYLKENNPGQLEFDFDKACE